MANTGITLGSFADSFRTSRQNRAKREESLFIQQQKVRDNALKIAKEQRERLNQVTEAAATAGALAKTHPDPEIRKMAQKTFKDLTGVAVSTANQVEALTAKASGEQPTGQLAQQMKQQIQLQAQSALTAEQEAQEKGRLATIEQQAKVEAGGGFETLTLPSGQLAKRDRITREIDTIGSAPERVFASIDGVTGVFTEQELAGATQQGKEVSRAPSVSNNQKAVVDAQSGQIVFATDDEVSANRERFRPLQERDIISRLELAARSAGIDPEKIKRGNLDNLTQEEAKAVAAELVKSDPLLSVLFGGKEGGQSLEDELKGLEE